MEPHTLSSHNQTQCSYRGCHTHTPNQMRYRHWEPRSDFPRASSPGKVPWVIQAVASHLSPQSYQPNEQPFTKQSELTNQIPNGLDLQKYEVRILQFLTYPGPVPFSSLTPNRSRWGLQMLYADCENQESGSESLSFRMLFNTCAGTSSPKIAGESRLTLTDEGFYARASKQLIQKLIFAVSDWPKLSNATHFHKFSNAAHSYRRI